MKSAHVFVILAVAAACLCPTPYGSGLPANFAEDEEVNFEACSEFVCDPMRIRRYTLALQDIRQYYKKNNRPEMPLSLEAKMMVISKYLRVVFKEWDFVGFYYLNKERSLDELEIGPYATIVKTPQPLFKKGQGLVGKVWEDEEAFWVSNVAKHKDWITFDARARSELGIPCFDLKGELFGVFMVYSELPHMFEETDQIALEEILNYLDY